MNRTFFKNIIRTIKGSFGRYIAILCIIALGVGFFSGLKVCKNVMIVTEEKYIDENSLFDVKVLSYMGFGDEDIEKLRELEEIDVAEGAVYNDFIYVNDEGDRKILRAHSITNEINKLSLVAGKMPENADECVVDRRLFDEDDIGKYIEIDDVNSEDTKASFKHKKYKITGIVNSVIYLNHERGTTTVGNGQLSAFVYMPLEGFNYLRYSEVYACSDNDYELYSKDYDDMLENLKTVIKGNCDNIAYIQTRNENIGFASFENDSSIVDGVAKVFPVFFFLIAALVCSTTMTRMIDDERTQIGTFRALGYSNASIMSKYMIYSGSAAIAGCIIGYFVGIRIFPYVIWETYGMLYGFAPVEYYFDVLLLVISVIVSLICSVGTTYFALKSQLSSVPAQLVRPKTPSAGKRVFLENISFIWKRMKFLHKVTVRNIFRFKKRMFMMVIGIAGCTALVLAGYGLDASISKLAVYQYDEIDKYDMLLTFSGEINENTIEMLKEFSEGKISETALSNSMTVNYKKDNVDRTVNLVSTYSEQIDGFIDLHMDNQQLEYPKEGEVVISEKLAEIAEVKIGDNITFTYNDNESISLKVSGVFENYVGHYAYISPDTYTKAFKEEYKCDTVYVKIKEEADPYEVYTKIEGMEGLLNTTVVSAVRERVEKMMVTLNSVVVLIIGCAGALAFIVLFNLSNINITERQREIATIKVLGFYKRETGAYVFRENLILTLMGVVVGLPLGVGLLDFVMTQIQIDMIAFRAVITPKSILLTIVTVLLFFEIVDLVMRKKIDKINMAESLKSIE